MRNQVEISKTLKDLRTLKTKLIPGAVVRGFRRTAKRGREAAVARTEQVFNLNSDYITRGIMFLPDKPRQIKAAIRGFQGRHHDFEASVFLRGASKPEKSLEFMVLHEKGGPKTPQNRKVAVPGHDLNRYKTKTGKGRTRKAWKPEELLKYYNRIGPNQKGSKQRGKSRRGKPKAFILESTKGQGVMIARRKSYKSRNLEILYRFLDSADIDKRWDFVKTVKRQVFRHLRSDVINRMNRIRLKR